MEILSPVRIESPLEMLRLPPGTWVRVRAIRFRVRVRVRVRIRIRVRIRVSGD